jgi:surface polysaccharide O-acyltransferase-like enzyme
VEVVGTVMDLSLILNQLSRFAVPYFFLISGYFWATKFKNNEDIKKPTLLMAMRIAIILVTWSVIYLLPFNYYEISKYGSFSLSELLEWNFIAAFKHPRLILLQGTKYHLWFLVSLLSSLIISWILISRNQTLALIALSLSLYILGLMGKAYADTPLGYHIKFDFRNGPFFGLIFFVTGYVLQRLKPKPSWFMLGLILFVLGVVMHFSEIYLLQHYWRTSMNQDYVLGTYFFGVGVGLMALSDKPILRMPSLSFLGPLVLGIYAVHIVFVELLRPLSTDISGVAIWEIGYPVVVLLLSIFTAYGMSRVRVLRSIVT